MPQLVAVFNQSPLVSDAELEAIVDAINGFSMPAFAKHWPEGRLTMDKPDGAWAMWLLDGDAPKGDLAFHIDPAGTPIMEIFPKTILGFGASLCQDMDHELKEALADPTAAALVTMGGRTFVKEVCDPVSADAIDLGNGLLGANFVYPSWFEENSQGAWDEGHLCIDYGEIRPGGYVEAEIDGQWQLTAMRQQNGLLHHRLARHGRLAYRARNRAVASNS